MRSFVLKYRILLLCMLASLVRLCYAWIYQPWQQAPDHLSWELLINSREWSFAHLIHYPHEGGTFLIALFARFLRLFTGTVSLALVTFLVDFASRYIQLYITDRVFGRKVLWLFAFWMVFPMPALVPWASVGFGMHAWCACFPFILIYQLSSGGVTLRSHLLRAVFWGMACWFFRSNLILLLVYTVFYLLKRQGKSLLFLPVALGVFGACLFVQQWFDPGFSQQGYSWMSIRGEQFPGFTAENFRHLYAVFSGPLTDAAVSARNSPLGDGVLRLGWWIVASIGFLSFLGRGFRRRIPRIELAAWALVAFFLIVYAFSPFYHSRETGGYVSYRHLMYIFPLLALLICIGWAALLTRISDRLASPYIKSGLALLVIVVSLRSFTLPVSDTRDYTNSGWVLGVKMGDRPAWVLEVVERTGKNRKEWLIGVGCGMAVAYLADEVEDEEQRTIRGTQLMQKLYSYPEADQPFLMEGILLAFSEHRTPVIDPRYQQILMDYARKHRSSGKQN